MGIALTAWGLVGSHNLPRWPAFWLGEMEATVSARCNPISEKLTCELPCIFALKTMKQQWCGQCLRGS